MTKLTATATEIKVGDVANIHIGNGKFMPFRVDAIRTGSTRYGNTVFTFYSDEYLPVGLTGPCAFGMLDGDTVELLAR